MNDTKGFFERMLVFNWLRPERALVDAHQLNAVRSLLPSQLVQPTLEYGCTDGVCTFVLLGGEALLTYDDYVDISDRPAEASSEDYFSEAMRIDADFIKHPAGDSITYGVSWREAHLLRAARLGMYKELIECALDAPIPLEDDCVNTIWAPNLFQNAPQNIEPVLFELKRLLRPGGTIVTILPDSTQTKFNFWSHLSALPEEVVRQMDRGIAESLTKNAMSDEQWRSIFTRSNLKVSGHVPFLPRIVSEVYQIGFRPMFPALMEAYSLLRKGAFDDLIRIKRQWIDTEYDFLEPLCDVGPEFGDRAVPLWHAYRLEHVD